MKRVIVLSVVFLGVIFLGGASVNKQPGNKEEWVVALPHKNSPEDIARLKEKALDGSKEAAAELAGINGFYSQIPEAILWGMIAAENGDKGALYNLAVVLADSPDPLQQRRARYWLKKMIDEKNEHSELAKNLLKQLEGGKIDGSPFPERYPKW